MKSSDAGTAALGNPLWGAHIKFTSGSAAKATGFCAAPVCRLRRRPPPVVVGWAANPAPLLPGWWPPFCGSRWRPGAGVATGRAGPLVGPERRPPRIATTCWLSRHAILGPDGAIKPSCGLRILGTAALSPPLHPRASRCAADNSGSVAVSFEPAAGAAGRAPGSRARAGGFSAPGVDRRGVCRHSIISSWAPSECPAAQAGHGIRLSFLEGCQGRRRCPIACAGEPRAPTVAARRPGPCAPCRPPPPPRRQLRCPAAHCASPCSGCCSDDVLRILVSTDNHLVRVQHVLHSFCSHHAAAECGSHAPLAAQLARPLPQVPPCHPTCRRCPLSRACGRRMKCARTIRSARSRRCLRLRPATMPTWCCWVRPMHGNGLHPITGHALRRAALLRTACKVGDSCRAWGGASVLVTAAAQPGVQ